MDLLTHLLQNVLISVKKNVFIFPVWLLLNTDVFSSSPAHPRAACSPVTPTAQSKHGYTIYPLLCVQAKAGITFSSQKHKHSPPYYSKKTISQFCTQPLPQAITLCHPQFGTNDSQDILHWIIQLQPGLCMSYSLPLAQTLPHAITDVKVISNTHRFFYLPKQGKLQFSRQSPPHSHWQQQAGSVTTCMSLGTLSRD